MNLLQYVPESRDRGLPRKNYPHFAVTTNQPSPHQTLDPPLFAAVPRRCYCSRPRSRCVSDVLVVLFFISFFPSTDFSTPLGRFSRNFATRRAISWNSLSPIRVFIRAPNKFEGRNPPPVIVHLQLMQSQNWLPWQRPLDPGSWLCLHWIPCPQKPTPRIKQRVASYHTTEVIAHRKPKSGCHGNVP